MKKTVPQAKILSCLDEKPFLQDMRIVMALVDEVKTKVRGFYYEVILSLYSCPECGGRLNMTGTSQCMCGCGQVIDPTLMFQKSPCCDARLAKKTFHYACSRCSKTVNSRFIFDEKVFDNNYFREMMRQSRQRKRQKREAIKQLLAASRPDPLNLDEAPHLESIPGLVEDLEAFIQIEPLELNKFLSRNGPDFNMQQYRQHILSILNWDELRFSAINSLLDDDRQDRVWRFVTLVFMQHAGEIEIDQQQNDLCIRRSYLEADT